MRQKYYCSTKNVVTDIQLFIEKMELLKNSNIKNHVRTINRKYGGTNMVRTDS